MNQINVLGFFDLKKRKQKQHWKNSFHTTHLLFSCLKIVMKLKTVFSFMHTKDKIKNQPQKENQQTRQWFVNSSVLDPQ